MAFVKKGSTAATAAAPASVAPGTVPRDVQESEAADAIKNTTVATTFVVEMNSTNINTDVVKEAIANTNVKRLVMNITASIGNITWSINRENFTSALDVAQINLDVKRPDTEVPASTVSTVAKNNEPTQQIELAHDGAFKGFSKAQLSMVAPAGVKAGTYANLFYYNNGVLKLESSGEVNASLRFTVAFRHASQYVIVYGKNMLQNSSGDSDDSGDSSSLTSSNNITNSSKKAPKTGEV